MVYAGGQWRTAVSFIGPLSVSGTDARVSARTPLSVTLNTTATATPSGGVAPYSYLWTIEDGNIPLPTLSNTTFATVNVTKTKVGPGADFQGQLRVVVTDATGKTATTLVGYSFTNNYMEPGGLE